MEEVQDAGLPLRDVLPGWRALSLHPGGCPTLQRKISFSPLNYFLIQDSLLKSKTMIFSCMKNVGKSVVKEKPVYRIICRQKKNSELL